MLQISLLWIAGALVLGHSFIPHHHHVAEQTACADDHLSHEHEKIINYTETCSCHDHADHAEACNLDQRTIVKQSTFGNWALVTKNLNVVVPEKNISAAFHSFVLNKLCEYFLSKAPSRAPPIV